MMTLSLLAAHLVVAFGSMGYSTYLFFAPSRKGIRAAAGLVALTVATGTWLVVQTAAPLATVCVTGLVYLAYISLALAAARGKLAKARV